MTDKQKEVVEFLESLVHMRYNIETLTKVLSKYFNESIKVGYANEEEDNILTDYNIMFDSHKEETYGYFDIYVLKMRRPGHDGSDFYVTEIGYEYI
jgi:subtilase family serine protease